MNQFFYTLSFCLKHFSYLFVLALPLITLEFAVSYLVLQLDLNENMSNDLIIESIQPVAIQLAVLGIVSMVLSIAFYGAMMVAFEALTSNQDLSINQAYLMGLRKFFPLLWSSIAASIGIRTWAITACIAWILPICKTRNVSSIHYVSK